MKYTTVRRGDQSWFVSTVERKSSCAERPRPYSETVVWELGADGMCLLPPIAEGEAPAGSLRTHERFVDQLAKTGVIEDE